MINIKKNNVTLSLKREILLILPAILILYLSIYALIAAPFMIIASLILVVFCIYCLVGIGRQIYSKVYLVILAIISHAALITLATFVSGYVMDGLGVQCKGFFGSSATCTSSMSFSASLMMFYMLIPLAILSIVGMIFQLRTSKHTR